MKKVLITGTAGFIGFHLARKLLEKGYRLQVSTLSMTITMWS